MKKILIVMCLFILGSCTSDRLCRKAQRKGYGINNEQYYNETYEATNK